MSKWESKMLKKAFKMPSIKTITARSSSITNAFISAISIVERPTEKEIEEVLEIFGMSPDNMKCCYCGSQCTEWDHLKPLVFRRKPTGYPTSIKNLIPACNKCNQSKGNNDWEPWIRSNERTSKLSDIEDRITRIKKYEEWANCTPTNFEEVIGVKELNNYLELCENILSSMQEAQKEARIIKEKVVKSNSRK